jgi:hypothetical protein
MDPTTAGGRASRRRNRGEDGRTERRAGTAFEASPEILARCAAWQGNTAALHREVVQRSIAGSPPAPSLATLQRALRASIGIGQGRRR